ncbi:hypothetical protein M1439_01300 [Candidatus Marsarchaeota archaeon]|jgi:hypothetical protein|nr:hypothetical protein [Candidatus Marsarchaeota archaeon]MCL5092689.1 hypothetical protein [Candidatus Marsarchaeota archaeon]
MSIFKKKPQNGKDNEEGPIGNLVSNELRKRIRHDEYNPEYKPLSLSDKYGPYEYPGETGRNKGGHRGIIKRGDE